MGKKRRQLKPDRTRYKTFWRRFWAGMADSIVFLPLMLLGRVVWAHSAGIPTALLVSFHILHSFAGYAYSILLHGFFGQTLGKMLFKVKVLDASEDVPLTMVQAVRRDAMPGMLMVLGLATQVQTILRIGKPFDPNPQNFGVGDWIMMSTGMLWFWAEIITMLTNRKRRSVHDFIAGSVVIRIPKQSRFADT